MLSKRVFLPSQLGWGLALSLLVLSCSSQTKQAELYPVRGKVFFNDKPAAGVQLTLIAEGATESHSGATSDADGTFSVTTDGEPGAPAGDYTVTMIWMQEKPPPDPKKGEGISMTLVSDPVDKLKGKLNNRAKSPYKVKVEKGNNEVPPFKLH
jgi:hypothetical protein